MKGLEGEVRGLEGEVRGLEGEMRVGGRGEGWRWNTQLSKA